MKITDIVHSIEHIDDMDQSNPVADAIVGGEAIQLKAFGGTKRMAKRQMALYKASTPKVPSKKEQVLAKLTSTEGATMEHLRNLTGWKNHSLHGLFNSLRRQGWKIECNPHKNGNVFFATAPAA